MLLKKGNELFVDSEVKEVIILKNICLHGYMKIRSYMKICGNYI